MPRSRARRTSSCCGSRSRSKRAGTEASGEGYFRLEWRLAVERAHATRTVPRSLVPSLCVRQRKPISPRCGRLITGRYSVAATLALMRQIESIKSAAAVGRQAWRAKHATPSQRRDYARGCLESAPAGHAGGGGVSGIKALELSSAPRSSKSAYLLFRVPRQTNGADGPIPGGPKRRAAIKAAGYIDAGRVISARVP
jgi:hypothetical protein